LSRNTGISEGIRNQVDVPVYPSYAPIQTINIDGAFHFADAAVRFAHIEALAARGLIEFAVIDPGSVNFTLTATISGANPAGTYMNLEAPYALAAILRCRKRKRPERRG
jgi:hypothetical protein